MAKVNLLRKKYPRFVYEDFSYKIKSNNLEIFFDFKIPPDIKFRPRIVIQNLPGNLSTSEVDRLGNLVFHLGLMEIPSYWKATCSPLIEIRAGFLDQEQINWWKKLLIDGMGQFYCENKIDFRRKNFLKIITAPKNQNNGLGKIATIVGILPRLKNRYLVPFAGGRDSIVTLEGLKKPFGAAQDKEKKDIALFTVNPIEKIQRVVEISGIKKQIIVRRIIDKKLLELNDKGCLNGHTPFTAVLSFISLLCAVIFDYRNIAFSNEKSADEGNVKYLGKIINHQWAKSSEFEKMFRTYAKKYLVKNINYFSYLRKYGELGISKMLTKYPQYFSVFSSCNEGMRINPSKAKAFRRAGTRWCGNCPKCLFVYMSLYPYLEEKELNTIFGKDIFQNKKLFPTLRGLIALRGGGSIKPFECVGTKKESRLAVELSLEKAEKEGKMPYLLTKLILSSSQTPHSRNKS